MHNVEGQAIVIPFYVCDVHQPIVSVSRLEEQGFVLTFNEEQRQITHPKGFNTTLIKDQSLYYLRIQSFQFQQTTNYRYNKLQKEQ